MDSPRKTLAQQSMRTFFHARTTVAGNPNDVAMARQLLGLN